MGTSIMSFGWANNPPIITILQLGDLKNQFYIVQSFQTFLEWKALFMGKSFKLLLYSLYRAVFEGHLEIIASQQKGWSYASLVAL